MGYELKAYIGRINLQNKSPEEDHHKEHYLCVYAMLDLCKIDTEGPLNNLIEDFKTAPLFNEDVYFYAHDGNTKIYQDFYDKPLTVIPVHLVYEAIQKQCTFSDYRRYHWFKALLEPMQDDPELENLYVVFYGH